MLLRLLVVRVVNRSCGWGEVGQGLALKAAMFGFQRVMSPDGVITRCRADRSVTEAGDGIVAQAVIQHAGSLQGHAQQLATREVRLGQAHEQL